MLEYFKSILTETDEAFTNRLKSKDKRSRRFFLLFKISKNVDLLFSISLYLLLLYLFINPVIKKIPFNDNPVFLIGILWMFAVICIAQNLFQVIIEYFGLTDKQKAERILLEYYHELEELKKQSDQ